MLVITVKPGEGVVIGDPRNPIGRVLFRRNDKGHKQLCFEGFDKRLSILRDELAEQVRTGKEAES